MDLDDVFKLIEAVNDSKVAELEIEKGDFRIKIKKETVKADSNKSSAFVAGKSEIVESKGKEEIESAEEFPPHLEVIRSPIVGTFYRAPSPDAPPYVEEGDIVEKGQVLCIVEAMKIMNEIESDVRGKIVKILVENAQPVEYGQPLFLIEPLS